MAERGKTLVYKRAFSLLVFFLLVIPFVSAFHGGEHTSEDSQDVISYGSLKELTVLEELFSNIFALTPVLKEFNSDEDITLKFTLTRAETSSKGFFGTGFACPNSKGLIISTFIDGKSVNGKTIGKSMITPIGRRSVFDKFVSAEINILGGELPAGNYEVASTLSCDGLKGQIGNAQKSSFRIKKDITLLPGGKPLVQRPAKDVCRDSKNKNLRVCCGRDGNVYIRSTGKITKTCLSAQSCYQITDSYAYCSSKETIKEITETRTTPQEPSKPTDSNKCDICNKIGDKDTRDECLKTYSCEGSDDEPEEPTEKTEWSISSVELPKRTYAEGEELDISFELQSASIPSNVIVEVATYSDKNARALIPDIDNAGTFLVLGIEGAQKEFIRPCFQSERDFVSTMLIHRGNSGRDKVQANTKVTGDFSGDIFGARKGGPKFFGESINPPRIPTETSTLQDGTSNYDSEGNYWVVFGLQKTNVDGTGIHPKCGAGDGPGYTDKIVRKIKVVAPVCTGNCDINTEFSIADECPDGSKRITCICDEDTGKKKKTDKVCPDSSGGVGKNESFNGAEGIVTAIDEEDLLDDSVTDTQVRNALCTDTANCKKEAGRSVRCINQEKFEEEYGQRVSTTTVKGSLARFGAGCAGGFLAGAILIPAKLLINPVVELVSDAVVCVTGGVTAYQSYKVSQEDLGVCVSKPKEDEGGFGDFGKAISKLFGNVGKSFGAGSDIAPAVGGLTIIGGLFVALKLFSAF